ncbi:unnamed protein product, partial [marine sediment metagenome]
AKKGTALWGDGYLARFMFIAPGTEEKRDRSEFPSGIQVIPKSLTDPLIEWDKRLGDGKHELNVNADVLKARSAYDNSLLDMIEENLIPRDLKGNLSK